MEIYAIDCRIDGVEDYQRKKDRIGEERREGKRVAGYWLLGKWAQQSKFTHTLARPTGSIYRYRVTSR